MAQTQRGERNSGDYDTLIDKWGYHFHRHMRDLCGEWWIEVLTRRRCCCIDIRKAADVQQYRDQMKSITRVMTITPSM